MNRRDLFKTAALPLVATGAIAQTAWKPELFDAHTNDTVVALSELIIPATDTPGAKAAMVNRWMDKLLAAGPGEQRDAFLEGLHWLDGFALQLHGHPFVSCTPQQQTAMLRAMDEGAEGPGRNFFRMAKALVSRIYYATEIGMQELNKGGRVPATFGCNGHSHA